MKETDLFQIDTPVFVLLTHERELLKGTNTGRLVTHVLGSNARVVVWQRKEPDEYLIEKLETEQVALVYPADGEKEDESCKQALSDFDCFIILDATWQQARKMYNQSPYLKELPKVSLRHPPNSSYRLRRNQKLNGAECVVELLRERSHIAQADELQNAYEAFNGN